MVQQLKTMAMALTRSPINWLTYTGPTTDLNITTKPLDTMADFMSTPASINSQ